MKLNKVAFAVASALAIAAGSAHAGQIQASATTVAKEVIVDDAQALIAPTTTYTFAGDINAQLNQQNFQLQYILDKGTWAVGNGNLFATKETLVPLTLAGSATDLLQVLYTDAANAAQTTFPSGTSVAAFISGDQKSLVFNVTIPQGSAAGFYLKTPSFTVNPPATNTKVTGLATLVGAVDCAPDLTSVNVSFKHALTNPGTATIVAEGPGSEHLRTNSTNSATMLNFVENIKLNFTAATAASRTMAASLNRALADSDSVTAGIQGNYDVAGLKAIVSDLSAAGQTTFATAVNAIAATSGGRHYLGKAKLSLMAAGQDLDYAHTYGIGFEDTTVDVVGKINIDSAAGKGANLTLTLPTVWPTGTTIFAVDNTGTPIPGLSYTTVAGDTTVSLSAVAEAAADKLLTGAYVFADFPGTSTAGMIPNTGNIAVKGTLFKAAAAKEQNNMCTGTFTGIGGGIKIDVRNYATYKSFGETGAKTLVRMINNSEANAADVYGQLIYADGTYGPWGKLGDLKPREVLSMSNKEIEEKLVNAPAATNPFGAGTSYTVTAGADVKGGTKAGVGDRLRIVSTSGSTLRVQSYMVLGSMILDTSNAQGVDFENQVNDRTPTSGVDAQPVSQDAINGLSRQ